MELLIQEVRKRSILWNRKDPAVKDRLRTEKEWDNVANIVGLSKPETRKKWRNLRDQFLKEIKKVPVNKLRSSEECAANYSGRWMHFSKMLFLNYTSVPREDNENDSNGEEDWYKGSWVRDDTEDKLLTRDTSKNATLHENDSTIDDDLYKGRWVRDADPEETITLPKFESKTVEEWEEKSHWMEGNNPQLDDADNEPQLHLNMETSSHRSMRNRSRLKNSEAVLQLLDLRTERLRLLEEADRDANWLFMRSLLPFMKKMNPLQQLRVRSRFQEILIAEMESLPSDDDESSKPKRKKST